MKYFVEEIAIMKDGSTPISITEKTTEREARASYHQAMASAIINELVVSIHVEAKNEIGAIYDSGTWTAPVEA